MNPSILNAYLSLYATNISYFNKTIFISWINLSIYNCITILFSIINMYSTLNCNSCQAVSTENFYIAGTNGTCSMPVPNWIIHEHFLRETPLLVILLWTRRKFLINIALFNAPVKVVHPRQRFRRLKSTIQS